MNSCVPEKNVKSVRSFHASLPGVYRHSKSMIDMTHPNVNLYSLSDEMIASESKTFVRDN